MSGSVQVAGVKAGEKRGSRAPKVQKALPYEGAGPVRLSKTPAKAKGHANIPPEWPAIKAHSEARINLLRSWRQSWMSHYSLLETYLLPRRGIFINTAQPTPNTMIRGIPINTAILDPTGTYAMRRCAAGLMSNEMSPSRQWFKLKPALFDREKAEPEALEWFEEVEDRINTVMSRSNFYQECAQVFEDIVTFGTGVLLIYEDDNDLIRCYTPCCGEYFLASSSANRVETFARMFVMTVAAIVEMFGLENCPPDVQGLWRDKGGALEIEKVVVQLVEPNSPIYAPGLPQDAAVVPGGFTWREAYWVWGGESDWPLSLGGFYDQPHIVPRWAVTSNDAYGRSPGMDTLSDVIQLQVMTARLAEAEEKMVRPPMLASIDMRNEPSSILPGKITYVNALGPDKGMRPAYTVNPQIKEFGETILMVQQRIREGLFSDLFSMLEAISKDMTAYEVAARNSEKLQVLGPVVERLQNEFLAPSIRRIFKIMERKLLLPPLPPSLHGVPLGLEYIGVVALSAKAAKTAGLERFMQVADQLQQLHPEIADVWSPEALIMEYGEDLFVSRKIFNDPAKIAALRAARAKQQQAQQMLMAANSASQTAKNLGQTDVGNGMSAMAAMTGFGSGLGGGEAQGSGGT